MDCCSTHSSARQKGDDIPAEVRMRCYRTLLENYYPADRVLLSTLPCGDAIRRSARSDLPRDDPQELRLHAFYRRTRSRRRW